MRALVTGAVGFIGRRLCDRLQADGWQVRATDLVPRASVGHEYLPAELGHGDFPSSLVAGVDTVFHLAGRVHALAESRSEEAEYFRVNTEGTRELLAAARAARVRRFVFFSTVKAMSWDGVAAVGAEDGGQRAEGGCVLASTEEDVFEPDTPYGKSKLEAEKLVLHGGYVPEPVVLRLCMVYGPGAKGNIQKMLDAVRRKRFPPLPEVGNRRSMVHVQDVVKAALLAAGKSEATGQVFIVSDGGAYSTRQMYEMMCRAAGHRPPGWSLPLWCLLGLGRAGDVIGKVRGRRFVFDSDALEKLIGSARFSSKKIETMLGFKPDWNLEKALPEMVAGMEQSGTRES
jgi:nucleoside-diphosphate-sugar epimerase